MTTNDITELEWLASSLAGVASKLQRAAKLLRCEHDLERAEARLAAIAADTSGRAKSPPPPPPQAAEAERTAVPDRRELGAALRPVGRSRTDAVFDVVAHEIRTAGKIDTGARRAPF